MSTPESQPPAWWDKVYTELISSTRFSNALSESHPRALLIGGQPGAGKSAAIERFRAEGSVPIVGDDLRPFHPDYYRLMEHDHLAMPEATAAASAYWVRRAIDEAATRGISVVVEGTFRRPATTMDTATNLHRHGFEVHVVAVAARPELSRLSTVTRYLEQREPRWTPHQAHEDALAGLPATLAAVEAAVGDTVASVRVVDRDARVLHDSAAGHGGSAVETMRAAHRAALAPDVARDWVTTWHRADQTMAERGLVNDTTRPTLDRLRLDESTIQAMTSPSTDSQARRARVERLRDAMPAPRQQLSFHEQTITEPGPHQRRQGPHLDLS